MRLPFRLSSILLSLLIATGTLMAIGMTQPIFPQDAIELERQAEADRLLQQGLELFGVRQFQAALQFLETALSLYRTIEDHQAESYTLGNLGLVYDALGQHQQAIEYHQQSLTLARELEDHQGEAYSLNNLGNSHRFLEQHQQAIGYYEQSLTLARDLEDHQEAANALDGLGFAYDALGQYQLAIGYYEQSLTLARDLEDRQAEVKTLNNLGLAYRSLGQYQLASERHQQSLILARELENQQVESLSLVNLGIVYLFLGRYQLAIEYYQQSLILARGLEDRQLEARVLYSLGNAFYYSNQYQQAIDYHEQSLALGRELEDRQIEGYSLNSLGLTYTSLGQYQQAIVYYEQSLAIARELEDRQAEATPLGNLGLAYDSLGQHQQAIDYYQQSLNLTREFEDRRGEGMALRNLGAAFFDIGEFSIAEAMFIRSLEVLESLRTSELSDNDKVAFFDTYFAVYKALQQALVAQNSPEKTLRALEVAEQGRARSLAESLAARLSTQQTEAIVTTAPNLDEIRRIAQQQNATLVEYSVHEIGLRNPALYIWVVQPTGEIHFAQVDLTILNTSLTELVTTSRSAIGVRGRNSATVVPVLSSEAQQQRQAEQRQNLQQLHQLLIAPIAQWLPSDPEAPVIFVPQDDLFLVPFPALMDANGAYLIEHHTILTAPSIQVLDLTHQQRSRLATFPQNSLNPLIVGNPVMPQVWNPTTNTQQQLSSLPGAEGEAIAIANALQTQPLLWDEATETTVKQQMPNTRIIHLATHGLLDYGNPQETGVRDFPGAIALAPSASDDGLLTAAEILEMNLNAELVVLSACDTGRGRITGDGVIGLSRSLITAGVPSVIVSLWSVSDRSTEYLMTHFYENLSHMNKAQALRQAMLTTMQQPEYNSPDSWAAFTLMGEAE